VGRIAAGADCGTLIPLPANGARIRLKFMHEQKMKSRAAFDGLFAGSNLRTAARMFLFGFINQFGFAAKDPDHRIIFHGARAPRINFSLMLFALAICCLPLRGADRTNVYEYEESIPKPGSIQWDRDHRIYEERRELYRKRLAIPDAVGTNVPVAAGAYLAFNRANLAAPAPAPSDTFGMFLKLLIYLALFIFSGVLILRRVAPHVLVDLNRQYNPWAVNPAAEADFTAKVLADEEAFGKYLAAFRIGPSAPPRVKSRGKYDPLVEFYAKAKKILVVQRKLLADIGQPTGNPARHRILLQLNSEMGGLKTGAGIPGALPVWQVASALEGLLKRLTEKVSDVSPSTLRTLSGGLDLLDDLCLPRLKPDLLTDAPFKFLIVDDDPVSRQALSLSLKKAFSQPDLAVDGESALALAARQAYDVIFLDVQMPGMDGFELCTKIRETVPNRTTPVVFVTSQSDFDARTQSTLSGGNDLMGKPFLIFEVTVKSLTLALRGRLQGRAQKLLPKPGKDLPVAPLTAVNGSRSVASSINAPRPLLPKLPLAGKDGAVSIFLDRASKTFSSLQELFQKILQTSSAEMRQTLLAESFLRISSLIPPAGPKVAHPAYQMGATLEGLIRILLQDFRHSTPSTLATVATAIDLLKDLCVPGLNAELAADPPIQILVVDDDLVARRMIVGALQTSFQKPESVESGEAALALLAEKAFDVIFLDVMMPGMDGFEVCAKIRDTIPNRATPVVFVTGLGDFDARAKVNSNGGNDLIGKPFLTVEITVKALTFALRGRLQQLNS
jgi:CheY-like chemotaxis protein